MTEAAADNTPKRGLAPWLVRLAGLACLGYLLYAFDLSLVIQTIGELPSEVFWACASLALPLLFSKWLRWHIMLYRSGSKLSVRRSLNNFASGIFWGLSSPGRVGEFYKAWQLKKYNRTPLSQGLSLVFLEKLHDLLALTVALAGTSGWVFGLPNANLLFWSCLGVSVLAWTAGSRHIMPILLHLASLLKGKGRDGSLIWEAKPLKSFDLALCLALSFMAMAVLVWRGCWLAIWGFALPFDPALTAFLIGCLGLGALVPLSIVGLGTNEALLLGLAGILLPGYHEPEKLIAFSLTLTVLNLVSVLSVSALCVVLTGGRPDSRKKA